jgi:hypothetical protein
MGRERTVTPLRWQTMFCLLLSYCLLFHTLIFGMTTGATAAAEASGYSFYRICHAGSPSQSQDSPDDQTPGLPPCCTHNHCVFGTGLTLPSLERATACFTNRNFHICQAKSAWRTADPPLKEVGRSHSRSPRAPPRSA